MEIKGKGEVKKGEERKVRQRQGYELEGLKKKRKENDERIERKEEGKWEGFY